jgi:hypothetical protein
MDGSGDAIPFGAVSSSTRPTDDRSLSPVPEQSGFEDSSMSPLMSPATTNDESKMAEEDLKAKIQAKKKKLAELKRRKEAAATSRAEFVLNADAPSFVPGESMSLADRNATRFAVKPSTITHLPDDLKNREDVASAYKEEGPEATQDIENAVSLVGTCQHMCPDDELLRRQREGDIQLLETPQPGTIHPKDWTLRETAVKRFRRSAADYKLDVPEWIRPPDVLEMVCGYLEEWVMVRHGTCTFVNSMITLMFVLDIFFRNVIARVPTQDILNRRDHHPLMCINLSGTELEWSERISFYRTMLEPVESVTLAPFVVMNALHDGMPCASISCVTFPISSMGKVSRIFKSLDRL